MMRYQKLLPSVALAIITMVSALAFGLSRPHAARQTPPGEKPVANIEEAAAIPTSQTETAFPLFDGYVRRRELWPQLRSAFGVMSDRLERPGKERLVMTGTMTRAGATAPAVFTLVREFPDRLRLEEGDGAGRRVSVYNRRADAEHAERPPREADDIETLDFDTAERFFSAQAEGAAMRHLGDRFRLADGGSGDALSAPDSFYNLYEVTDEVNTGGSKGGARSRRQAKVYALNSDTLLLERVRYEIARDGETVRVEVRLGDWRQEGGEMVPHTIERREDDRVVLSLDIKSVVVGPRIEDEAFTSTRLN